VSPAKTYYINGLAENIQNEIERYANLIKKYGIDIACVGIGENGHLAFNDPHVADFNDPLIIKTVELDEISRQQQVNDGCFENLSQVPKKALTLTMSTIFSSDYIIAVVPAKQKAVAVKETIYGEISVKCPASILRKHKNAFIFLDTESASLI
jgi:glucosamine-6-phosphate deaminase